MIRLSLAVAVAFCFTGLASATNKLFLLTPQAVLAKPLAGYAIVYVLGPYSAPNDPFFRHWAYVDDKPIGANKRHTYVFTHVPEGRHTLWTRTGCVLRCGIDDALKLDLKAGNTYYFTQYYDWAQALVSLMQVNADEGKRQLAKYRYSTLSEKGHVKAKRVVSQYSVQAQQQARSPASQ